jgi:hypothetical protein
MNKIKFYKLFPTILLLGFTLNFISCGTVSQKSANEMFLKKNPTFVIVKSYPGEGWEDILYYHFEYKKPTDGRIYKEVWCFEKQDDGTWKVTSQFTPKE